MVNLVDKNVPTRGASRRGKVKNIKWVASSASRSHTCAVVYGGRVFVGTNNDKPRDPKIKGDKAVLMCFAEKDGNFLWQNVHEHTLRRHHAACSRKACARRRRSKGDFIYYCTPACVVVCAKANDGKIVWQ